MYAAHSKDICIMWTCAISGLQIVSRDASSLPNTRGSVIGTKGQACCEADDKVQQLAVRIPDVQEDQQRLFPGFMFLAKG